MSDSLQPYRLYQVRILQTRIPNWVAMPSLGTLPNSGIESDVSHIDRHVLYIYACVLSCLYIYYLPLEPPSHPFPHPNPLDEHRARSWAPRVRQQLPANHLFVSILALQTGASFHTYVLKYNTCFSLSDFLHSVWQAVGSSTSLWLTQFHSFLWLSDIPLYTCTTTSSIRLLMDM